MNAWAFVLKAPLPYAEGLRLQQSAHALCCQGRIPDTFFLLQHAPTVTLGRRGRTEHLSLPPEEYARKGIEVVHASRGGDVTYHGPGQWVLYPILHLGATGADAHGYLWNLEEIALRTCAAFGVEAWRREGKSGAWTAQGKVAAIGFHIKRGVTLHGMSFNVSGDLHGFRTIVPCGLVGEPVATLADALSPAPPPSMDAVADALLAQAGSVLGRSLQTFSPADPWPDPLASSAPFAHP